MQFIGGLSKAHEARYEVVSPLGDTDIKNGTAAPSLDTLDGKTIGELSDDMYSFDMTFPAIRESLRQRYRDIKFVPHTEFPKITMMTAGPEYKQYVEDQIARIKQRGCDAVIVGNGG